MKTLAQYIVRQHELKEIMANSDKYASKCFKLGLSFKDTYPEEYEAYTIANDEYNKNEIAMIPLRQQAEERDYQKMLEFKAKRRQKISK